MTGVNDRTNTINEQLNSRAGGMRAGQRARDQRQANDLVQDIIDMVPRHREPPRLKREEPKGGIPGKRGYAERALQPGTGTGGSGIASPLTETARTYAEDHVWVESVEGYGYWRVKRVASMTFEDAEGREIVENYIGTQPAI